MKVVLERILVPTDLSDESLAALRYGVAFTIPAVKTAPITGKMMASFTLAAAAGALPFDFAYSADHVMALRVNHRDVTPAVTNGHVVIPARALAPGPHIV